MGEGGGETEEMGSGRETKKREIAKRQKTKASTTLGLAGVTAVVPPSGVSGFFETKDQADHLFR